MFKIDCHSHFFDPFIHDGISQIFRGNDVQERENLATSAKREFLSPEDRIKLMDRAGVDMSATGYQIAWQRYDETKYPASVRVSISRLINDRLAEVIQKYPDRFIMLADMPLMDVTASIEELKRSHKLGAKGLCLNTNVIGKPLTGAEFEPFWLEVDRLGLPVFLHPRSNLTEQRISRQYYHNMVGFPCETTVAACDFLVSGFFDKYKRINIMLCHCGGALPFIRTRLDDTPPLYGDPSVGSLINKFFYDNAISFPRQLQFTIDEVGLDQMCYGSDYPYFGFTDFMKPIEALNLDDKEKEKIYSGNARRFFGIT